MTSEEIKEQLKTKKATLESYRSGSTPANPAAVKALEDEIKQLESAVSSGQPIHRSPRRSSSFLDDCR